MFAPTEIKSDPAPFIREKRQRHDPATHHFKIPAAVRIGIPSRMTAAAADIFVGHSNDVEIEIVKRIAESPLDCPVRVVWQIPCRRHGVVGIFEPPNRIELVVEMDLRQIGFRRNADAVPVRGIGGGRRTFHWCRRYFHRVSLSQRRCATGEQAACRQHNNGKIFCSTSWHVRLDVKANHSIRKRRRG